MGHPEKKTYQKEKGSWASKLSVILAALGRFFIGTPYILVVNFGNQDNKQDNKQDNNQIRFEDFKKSKHIIYKKILEILADTWGEPILHPLVKEIANKYNLPLDELKQEIIERRKKRGNNTSTEEQGNIRKGDEVKWNPYNDYIPPEYNNETEEPKNVIKAWGEEFIERYYFGGLLKDRNAQMLLCMYKLPIWLRFFLGEKEVFLAGVIQYKLNSSDQDNYPLLNIVRYLHGDDPDPTQEILYFETLFRYIDEERLKKQESIAYRLAKEPFYKIWLTETHARTLRLISNILLAIGLGHLYIYYAKTYGTSLIGLYRGYPEHNMFSVARSVFEETIAKSVKELEDKGILDSYRESMKNKSYILMRKAYTLKQAFLYVLLHMFRRNNRN